MEHEIGLVDAETVEAGSQVAAVPLDRVVEVARTRRCAVARHVRRDCAHLPPEAPHQVRPVLFGAENPVHEDDRLAGIGRPVGESWRPDLADDEGRFAVHAAVIGLSTVCGFRLPPPATSLS